jgi:two-component system NtrC family response regulator
MVDKPAVLIIEDDDCVRNQMKWALNPLYQVCLAEDRRTAIAQIRDQRPSVVTLDLGLPPSSDDAREGFIALNEMLQLDPLLKVIVVTGQDEEENALAAIGQGAFDFFCKPVDIEALKVVVGRAAYIYEVETRRRELLQGEHLESLEGMIGRSPQMQRVFETIRKVAGTDAPVLIVGESGTGKEMAARAIHRLGKRKAGPFIPINCGAIPENLLESELFGHEKGAFTGAHVQREGRIEAARGGTLFLDEIGDLALPLQVKLLRFLQEGQIERVGGRKPIAADARVMCATNGDLKKAMAEGHFREDLYYRIGVVVITMPPLRERDGDLRLLAETRLERLAAEQGRTLTLSRKALEAIEAHAWPGNVRELENRLRRAVIMAEGSQITPEDLELGPRVFPCESMGLFEAREAVEREMIESALARNRGNLTRCAEDLKVSRPRLYELIEKLGIARKTR